MDYDEVSETNLNRQFCFRLSDINQSKVKILKEYFTKINPKFNLITIEGKVQDFTEEFYMQYDIIISALDNNKARKYLNEMAFKNNLPLIDAGTAGYNGQVQSYIRG